VAVNPALHWGGVFTPRTARQSCLFNVAVCAAAVHCESRRVRSHEERKLRAEMSCRMKASSLVVTSPLQVPDI